MGLIPLFQLPDALEEALQYKANWIPARTYLAHVYQALGRTNDAATQLSSILGKSAPAQHAEAGAPLPAA